jgi:hypothetical protein
MSMVRRATLSHDDGEPESAGFDPSRSSVTDFCCDAQPVSWIDVVVRADAGSSSNRILGFSDARPHYIIDHRDMENGASR